MTSPQHRPLSAPAPGRADRPLHGRPPGSAATRSTWARCRARATSARRSASPTSWPSSTGPAAPPPRGPALGGPRPLPALDRPLRDRDLRRARRSRHHPVDELETYGSDDSRLPMSGNGVLHARRGDLRRIARPRPRRRDRDGTGLRHLDNPASVLQPALRRRARRGLDLGGRDGLRAPPLDNVTAIVDVNALQADGPPRACCAPSRSSTSGARSAGTHCASTATTSPRSSPRSTRCRAPRLTLGADLRHPDRPRRAADRAVRRPTSCASKRTNGRSPAGSSGRPPPMTTTTNPPKLNTSAMIASFADPGQQTTRPRSATPSTSSPSSGRDRRPLRRPRQVHRHARLPRQVHPSGSSRWACPSSPARHRSGLAEVGLVPFASTYAVFATGAPTTSSASTSPSRASTSTSSAACRPDHRLRPSHQATEDSRSCEAARG